MNTDNFQRIEAIYIGRETTSEGKLGGLWLPIDHIAKLEDANHAYQLASLFAAKERNLPKVIGIAYVLNGVRDDEGQIIRKRGDYKFEGNINKFELPEGYRAAWEAQDKAKRVADRVRKRYKEMRSDDALRDQLKSLQADYHATDRIGRLALEVVVLDILRS